MATTTFNGPVRSEKGFQTVSKNATTGTITVTSGDKMKNERYKPVGQFDSGWNCVFSGN